MNPKLYGHQWGVECQGFGDTDLVPSKRRNQSTELTNHWLEVQRNLEWQIIPTLKWVV